MRLLTTGGEHVGGLAIVRALRVAGYEPWTAVVSAQNYAARSRAIAGAVAVRDPRRAPDQFAADIADAASRIGARAVLPGTEAGLLALSRNHNLFGNVKVGVPPADVVERATDKASLGGLAQRSGLHVPPTESVDPDSVGAIELPAVIKPLRSELEAAGGLMHVAPRLAKTHDEAMSVVSAFPGKRALVQPFLHGQLGAVVGVAWEGSIVTSVHQRSERIWPPDTGISAFARTVPRDAELDRGVAALMSELQWSGLFQVQFVHVANDLSYLIDVNPRAYGSLALAVAAGANLPAIWTDLLLGRSPSVQPYRVGVSYRTEEGDPRALYDMARKNGIFSAARGALPHRGTTHAVFSVRDPRPLTVTLQKLLARKRIT